MADDNSDTFATIFLLLIPLLLLFLKGRFGDVIFDKVVVWIFFIYLFIALVYVVNNEGKAQSNQVVWDDGHFSTNMREPIVLGDFAVFWDGINWPVPVDFKKRVTICHKDNIEKIGQNFIIRSIMYKRTYYEVPEDVKKIFRTFDLRIDKIMIGLVSRHSLARDPNLLFFESQMARLNDENASNREYAQAKVGDFEKVLMALGRWGDIGAKKNLIQVIGDKISGSGSKLNEGNDVK